MATLLPQTPAGPPAHLYTPTSAPRQTLPFLAGIILLAIGFIVFIVGGVVAAVAGLAEGPLVASFCGFAIIIIGGILLGVAGMAHRRPLPPPPPIRTPPTAPGAQGMAVEIACPNCGAAPRNIDRFGVATCDYCGTRFLVR